MSLRSFVFRSCSEPPPEHPPTTSKPLLGRSLLTTSPDMLSRAGYAKGRRILDAGTGPGYGAAMLRCCRRYVTSPWPLTSTTR